MNIIEAIKTGKRIKRKAWKDFFGIDKGEFSIDVEDTGIVPAISARDIVADDWEIEEVEVKVTKSELYEACKNNWCPRR